MAPAFWPIRDSGSTNAPTSNKNIAVTPTGDVYITGQTTTAQGLVVLATWRYDSLGQQTMLHTWSPNEYAKFPRGVAVACDSLGNAYVAGTYATPGQGTDIVILYYIAGQNTGTQIDLFNGTGNGDDYAVNIVIDTHGNGWLGAVTQNGSHGYDYLVRGYSSSGPIANASATYDRGNKSDILADIACYTDVSNENGQGDTVVCVTGTSYESPTAPLTTKEDIQTLQYRYNYITFSMTETTSIRYATADSDIATSIGIFAPGVAGGPAPSHTSIFVSGYTNNNSFHTKQLLVLGYPHEGPTAYWDRRYPAIATATSEAYAAKLVTGIPADRPNDRNVYVAGTTKVPLLSGAENHVIVFAYARVGADQWSYASNALEVPGNEEATDIATNDSGHVYVMGKRFVNGTLNYRTIKLDTARDDTQYPGVGAKRFEIEYDSTGSDWGGAVRVKPSSSSLLFPDIFVSGQSISPSDPTIPGPKFGTLHYIQTP